jgi:glycolate oxidase iron-sulfur subunit
MARKNLDLAEELSVDAVVSACATCSSFLKEYPALLNGDDAYQERAKRFGNKVRDIGEFLLEIGLDTHLSSIDKKITWHDPCHLGRYQKLSAPPRQILKSIPGVEYVELIEANVCCGGAGLYNVTHPDISARVLDRKMSNVSRTGADLLATSCPSCAIQLSYGSRKHDISIQTMELVQILESRSSTKPTAVGRNRVLPPLLILNGENNISPIRKEQPKEVNAGKG